jgi:predicted metal-dependent hydrolase
MSHIANGVNLLFPAGERFFVRSVRHYLPRITDARLRADVKGFFGQEGRHAKEHERFFEIMRDQAFDVDAFLGTYQRIAFERLERMSPAALNLSVTVALEHFTAILADNALTDRLLDDADPSMRSLLLWHAAEEIEHKAVAFDVLRAVHPSYALRMTGLGVATVALGIAWVLAVRMLVRQDGTIDRDALKKELRAVRKERKIGRNVFWRGIREYARRDFHPDDKDNYALAAAHLARMAREPVAA